MRIAQIPPWAAVSVGMWIATLIVPFMGFHLPVTLGYIAAAATLAMPCMLLCVMHLRLERSSRRHLFIALLNVPLAWLWKYALLLMWYLAPGPLGAVVFGSLLSLIALIGVWLTRFIREKPRGDVQPSPAL